MPNPPSKKQIEIYEALRGLGWSIKRSAGAIGFSLSWAYLHEKKHPPANRELEYSWPKYDLHDAVDLVLEIRQGNFERFSEMVGEKGISLLYPLAGLVEILGQMYIDDIAHEALFPAAEIESDIEDHGDLLRSVACLFDAYQPRTSDEWEKEEEREAEERKLLRMSTNGAR